MQRTPGVASRGHVGGGDRSGLATAALPPSRVRFHDPRTASSAPVTTLSRGLARSTHQVAPVPLPLRAAGSSPAPVTFPPPPRWHGSRTCCGRAAAPTSCPQEAAPGPARPPRGSNAEPDLADSSCSASPSSRSRARAGGLQPPTSFAEPCSVMVLRYVMGQERSISLAARSALSAKQYYHYRPERLLRCVARA